MDSIAKLDQATRMLAEIHSVDDAKQLIDLAEAARVYAKQVGLGLEAQNHAAEIKLRAQRRAGEILDEMEGSQGARTDLTIYQPDKKFKMEIYRDLDIRPMDANRWQTIAEIPEDKFESLLSETKQAGKELTTAEFYNFERKEKRRQNIEYQIEEIDKGNFRSPEGLFDVLVIDPPWQYGEQAQNDTSYDPKGRRASNAYPQMSLEEIEALKLPAAEDCILWLWTTHKFMRHSFKILDTWGFRDVAILTWVKDRMGLGSWLRSQSEFCIMAVRGKPLIKLTNQTTIINGPLREHSRKPDEFYAMVNDLCPGKKLDYFSREERKGWAQYGNDSNRF